MNSPFSDFIGAEAPGVDYHSHETGLLKMKAPFTDEETPKAGAKTNSSCEGRTCWAKTVLNNLSGLNLSLNNTLDASAKKAITDFQLRNNIPQSGQIDPVTERTLLEAAAIQKARGTGNEPGVAQIINTARTKVEDWTKGGLEGVKEKPKYILNSFRDPRKVWAFVLHHMAFKRKGRKSGQYSDPTGYLKTGAHFCIMLDGRIIQLHPLSRMIWHGNCLSPRSVAVEFEGNFPSIKGKWWIDKDSTVQNKDIPTAAQYEAGQFLARYLKTVLGTTHIMAHRQSSASRQNDPGPDIWFNVGQWAINNLNMTDGGANFKCGDGNPILPEWRTWGEKTSTLIKKEMEDFEEYEEPEDNEAYENYDEYEEYEEPQEYEEHEEFEDEEAMDSFNNFEEQEEYEENEEWEDYSPEEEDLIKDIADAVRLNRYYANNLGWDQYREKINDLVLPFSGLQNTSLGEEDFARAVAGWQQSQGFSAKDCDGIIGTNSWRRMQEIIFAGRPTATVTAPVTPTVSGLTFTKYTLLDTPIIVQRRDRENKYAEIREVPAVFLKQIVKNAGENPDTYFDRYTKITFLGRKLKSGQLLHEKMATHLKQLEHKLAIQYGGPSADPSIAGDYLQLSHEGISGSRKSSDETVNSMHLFGLAVDINYTGSPYLQPKGHNAFNAWMGKVANLVDNAHTNGINWDQPSRPTPVQFLKLYDEFSLLNNYVKKYFSLIGPQHESTLARLLSNCNFAPWKNFNLDQAKALISKDLEEVADAWNRKQATVAQNGFLGVSRELVQALVESGLDWGGRYGDMMHFDLRLIPGTGKNIDTARKNYLKDVKRRSKELYNQINNEAYSEDLVTDLSKTIRLNTFYAQSLGWQSYYDKINDLILPYSGMQNVSLGQEAFAHAVAAWQQAQGFAAKDCDGIIGPKTWEKMNRILSSPVIPSGSGSLENPPATWSSEKVPPGFKESSYKEWKGLDKKSDLRVDEAARILNANGALTKMGITETDIDTFQRLASAETGGRIQNFYSLDTAIVSMGFRQFTFIHNNIHDWIKKAPAAFRKYGIEIDERLPPYKIQRTTGTYTVQRIKGVDDPETLRWNGWAQRFYYAGLDHEIIFAEFLLAKEYFAKELGKLKSYLKNAPDQFERFMYFYNRSAHIRAFFHELNNAAPSRVPAVVAKALAKTSFWVSGDSFADIFYRTAKESWPNPAQVERIYTNTAKGSNIKLFGQETTSWNETEIENEALETAQAMSLESPEFENYSQATRLDKIRDYLYLLLFKVPDNINAGLKSRSMYVQYAHQESYSNDLNADFYRLRIFQYPLVNGVRLDAAGMIKYIRLNINSLLDTDYCDFYPYNEMVDGPVWRSDNPLGSVLRLDIKGPDNASVVVSLAKPNGWRFSTVHTPVTGDHPVSGHREFFIGIDPATKGTYFVIKGLDMMSTGIAGAGMPFAGEWGFRQADALWKSFRAGIIRFINANGGSAKEDITYSERVEWRYVYHRYKNQLANTFGQGAGSAAKSSFIDFEQV